MLPPASHSKRAVITLWLLVALAVPIWAVCDASGWDVTVYRAAMRSLSVGHDPYVDGIAQQTAYHARLELHRLPAGGPPNSYVYPPITFPALRLLSKLPAGLIGAVYWIAYSLGAFAAVWAGMQAVEPEELKQFAYLAPVAVFFPALLENGVILCGNVAYIFYGVALAAAVIGWKSDRWLLFYITVVAGSCVKLPLLTLLAIPVFSASRQWPSALRTAGVGIAIFVTQLITYPVLFRHFMEAAKFQVNNNRDFGSSPSGLIAGYLFDHGIPYTGAAFSIYLAYALPLFVVLAYFSRRFKGGALPLTRWIPVLLLGVVLLNPRIIEYDLAILTLPLALIMWRLVPKLKTSRVAAALALMIFVTVNVIAFHSWIWWKSIAGGLLIACFLGGARQLYQQYPWSAVPKTYSS